MYMTIWLLLQLHYRLTGDFKIIMSGSYLKMLPHKRYKSKFIYWNPTKFKSIQVMAGDSHGQMWFKHKKAWTVSPFKRTATVLDSTTPLNWMHYVSKLCTQ